MDLMGELRARLRVNKHALEDELETQAEVLDRIGREVSRADSRAQAAADRVKRMEASAFSDLKAGGSSDRVSELAARRDPDRMKAFERKIPGLVDLRDRVAARPNIKAYLASDRRIAFNEEGIFRRYKALDA